MKNDLGPTEVEVLTIMNDLDWWTIYRMARTVRGGADQAMRRLFARGFLERIPRIPQGYQYRLTLTGLEMLIARAYGKGAQK